MNSFQVPKDIIKSIPTPTLILTAESPNFTIVLANKAYLNATTAIETDLIGQNFFDTFPQNPHDHTFNDGVIKLKNSLELVIATKQENVMLPQRYDIPIRGTDKFDIRYWEPINTPITNDKGDVEFIIHTVLDITEKVSSNINLKITESRYKNLINSVDAVMWESDASTLHNKYISPQAQQIFGYSLEDWQLPGFWKDHIHPEDRQAVLDYTLDRISKEKYYSMEYRMIAADNSIVWVSDRVSIIFSESKPTLLRGVLTDITQRKKAEQEAQINQAKISKILDRSLDLICSLDGNGQFVEINSASQRILGYSPSELVGKSFLEFIHEDDKQKTLQAANSLIGEISTITFQNRYISKSGKVVPMWWSAHWDDEEKLLFGIGKDASEMQEAEIRLIQSEQRFKSLVQYGADFIAIVNEEGYFTYCSLNSEKILGYKANELIGQNAFSPIHPLDVEHVTGLYKELLSGKPIISETFRYKTSSGKYKWMETMVIDMRENPAVSGIVINSRDVTEKKAYLEWQELVNKATHNAIYDWDMIDKEIKWGGNSKEFYASLLGKDHTPLDKWENGLHPDDKETIIKSLNNALENPSQTKWKEEYRFIGLENEYIHIVDEGYILREANGKAYRMIGALTDISDRKQFEQELREINQRFELVTRATSDAVWDWDLLSGEVFRGIGYKNLFGYDLEQSLLPISWWKEKIHPQDFKKISKSLENILTSNLDKLEFEYRIRMFNGEYRYVYDRGFALRNEKGKVVRMVGAMQDIHHEKIQEIEADIKLSISKIFANEESLHISFMETLKTILEVSDYDYAEIWVPNIEQSAIILKAHYSKSKYTITGEKIIFQMNEGFPGFIWNTKKYFSIDDINESKYFLRQEFAIKNDLQCVHGNPILYNDEVKAVMLLYCKKGTEKTIQKLINQDILNLLGSEINRKTSEAELDFFFELSPDLMCINDLNGNYIKVNKAFYNLLSYEKTDLLNTPFLDYIHPDDMGIFDNLLVQIQSGSVMDHESRFKAKAGNYIWISWTARPFPAEGMILAVGKDISEKKKQEEALETSNRTLSDTLESIQDGFIAINRDWTISYWNKEAENIIKIKREEVIGKFFWEAFPEALNGKFFHEYNKCVKEQITVRFEEYFSPIEAWLQVIAYPSESGITVYFNDITDKKNASLKLLQFKNVIENSKDEIAIISTINETIYLNPSYTESFGYGVEKLKQIGGPQIVFANENQAAEVYLDLLAGKYWKGDVELLSKDRKIKSYYISAGPIFNDDHKLIAVYLIHTDISSRKEIEYKVKQLYSNLQQKAKELANLKEELNHFGYIASSNLQEPLYAISENLKYLKEDYSQFLDDKGHHYLENAVHTSDYMSFILAELLKYSLVDQAGITYEKIDLNKVLKDTMLTLRQQILDKFAKIDIPKLPTIKGYEPHFKEIFTNLILNSLTFQKEQPVISVEFSTTKTHWLFSVSDNGVGINSSDFDKIFNLFQTLEQPDGQVRNGMGLAVTKKIVEKYGGKIWVESEVQKGSVFYFTISKDL